MRCLSLLFVVLTCSMVRAQYLGFVTRAGDAVDAPVSLADGSPPGPDVQAQLFRILDDGTLLPLVPTTTFQTDAADPRLRYYVKTINIIVPDIMFPDLFADPIEITVLMRAWQGPDWSTSRLKGESEPVTVLIHNLLYPPANMEGLKGFTLEQFPRISSSTIASDGQVQLTLAAPGADSQSVTIERSTNLVTWRAVGQFDVSNGQTFFTDPEAAQLRTGFYRVRFE